MYFVTPLMLVMTLLLNIDPVQALPAPPPQDKAEIITRVTDHIKKYLEEQHIADRFEVSVTPLDKRLQLRQCTEALDLSLVSKKRIQSSVTVTVRCNDSKPWKIYVPARVRLYRKVIVANHYIPPGKTLAADDLASAVRDISQLRGGAIHDSQRVIGKKSRRPIKYQSVIAMQDLREAPLVHRGKAITIVANRQGIEIRARGTALENGTRGDYIKVKNSRSNKVLDAVVSGDGTVEVR